MGVVREIESDAFGGWRVFRVSRKTVEKMMQHNIQKFKKLNLSMEKKTKQIKNKKHSNTDVS